MVAWHDGACKLRFFPLSVSSGSEAPVSAMAGAATVSTGGAEGAGAAMGGLQGGSPGTVSASERSPSDRSSFSSWRLQVTWWWLISIYLIMLVHNPFWWAKYIFLKKPKQSFLLVFNSCSPLRWVQPCAFDSTRLPCPATAGAMDKTW